MPLSEPAHLDVHKLSTSYVGWGPSGSAYSGLVKPQSTGHGGKIVVTAELAEKWEQPDPTTYVLTLRPNAKFQNIAPVNGRVVTAQDVVYSFNRQIAEKVNASSLPNVTAIDALDERTVRLKTAGPDADFLGSLVDYRNCVVAKEAVDIAGHLENGPTIGTGPWIAKEWRKGVSSSYVRNPDYFEPSLPYADVLNYVVIKDPVSVEAQYKAGTISFTATNHGLSVTTVKNLARSDGASLYAAPLQPNHWVLPNFRAPELKDPRIVQALSMAIDRTLLVANALEGNGQPDGMGAIMPSPDWYLPQDELKTLHNHDPKAAKALLDAAGGLPKITVHFYAQLGQATAELVQANWRAIGAEVTLSPAESAQAVGDIFNPASARYILMITPILHFGTLTADLESWYKTGGSRNSSFINDAQLDRMIEAQKAEFDIAKRKDLVQQIQRLIVQKSYHMGLTAASGLYAVPKRTHNVEPLWLSGYHIWLSEVWFDA